jgi:thioesterase domain-containing protein
LNTMLEVTRNNIRMLSNYEPTKFSGDTVLIVAANSPYLPSSELWKPYVQGRIQRYDIACHHGDMMKPFAAAEIGKIITERLHATR